jgi:hypothetical protein
MHNHSIAQRQIPRIIPSTQEGFVPAPRRRVGVMVRRVTDVVMDALMLLAIILSIPFIILAIGIPIALVVQLLLLIGRHL